MKNTIGFLNFGSSSSEPAPVPVVPQPEIPVKSLVQVRFPGGRKLAYYNDRFDLSCGDAVYVSGKLAGIVGVVVEVTTKFRIHTSDYERVLARLDLDVHGNFVSVADKMVSLGEIAVTPSRFESWVTPPMGKKHEEDKEDEVISGEGYVIDLENIGASEGLREVILERALDYCSEGKVAYVSVCNGVGTAFMNGTRWYRVDFHLDHGIMRDVFCDCPYAGLCKHEVAVAITLQVLFAQEKMGHCENFVALDQSVFWKLASRADTITI